MKNTRAGSSAHSMNLRHALLDIAEHHEDCIDALGRGQVPEARRALARAQRAVGQAEKYAGMMMDTLNTAKAQTSAGVTFGTSDGSGPPGLDKPRSTSFTARQQRLRELGPGGGATTLQQRMQRTVVLGGWEGSAQRIREAETRLWKAHVNRMNEIAAGG